MGFKRHDEEIGQLAQGLFYLDPAITSLGSIA